MEFPMSKLVLFIAVCFILAVGIALGSWITNDEKPAFSSSAQEHLSSDATAPDTTDQQSMSTAARSSEATSSIDQKTAAHNINNSKTAYAPWDSESTSAQEFAPSSLKLSNAQLSQLHEINEIAADLAETYDTTGYTPPEIPKDIEEKLRALSPALLTLVRIASRIPPRQASSSKTSKGK